MTEPAASRSLVVERELPHPPEKVWRALTEGPLIANWLLPNDFQPAVGHRFTFRSPAMPPHWDGIIDAEVVAVEPFERLSYRWDALGLRSVVTWTLTPTAGGVLVRMEQSGFRPEQQREYQGAGYGWRNFFEGLERTVAGLD